MVNINYKGYQISVKKDGKFYFSKGIKGVFEENSYGEDQEDAINHLKQKIDMSEAFVEGQELLKK